VIIVSNTSPLMNLAVVEHLNLLPQLYGPIQVPRAVLQELSAIAIYHPGVHLISTLPWIECASVTDLMLVESLRLQLDPGEAEAIALAVEKRAERLLIDERRGRQIAAHMGLKSIGVLGLLLEAKHKGLLPTVQPVLDDLISKAGFWVSRQLYQQVLQAARE
jgi:predicted nucleic acid-binding protein